ncbi:uncharacterized protein LOC141618857 [Silene latifolia]|uniref:uncharacterized protein LOC141618857 n=1 Tax=Silene latifolia TaxID=37657 RepID=UPI003D777901
MTQAALTTFPGNSVCRVTRASVAASKPNKTINIPCLDVQKPSVSRQHESGDGSTSFAPVSRRNVIALGIGSVILGLNVGEKNDAWAAAKRPPPRPPGEKKDPNVNGVLAKVLASKKRKEAMKEEMARQRERGKKVAE